MTILQETVIEVGNRKKERHNIFFLNILITFIFYSFKVKSDNKWGLGPGGMFFKSIDLILIYVLKYQNV